MTRYLVSFDDGAMTFPEEELPDVAEAAHAVVREAMDAGVWVFGGGLEDRRASIVGTDRYVIFAVAYQKVRADFVARFPGGTVHAHGVGKPGSGKVPVVGGTGLYAGATGVAEGRHLANGKKLNVYRLRIP